MCCLYLARLCPVYHFPNCGSSSNNWFYEWIGRMRTNLYQRKFGHGLLIWECQIPWRIFGTALSQDPVMPSRILWARERTSDFVTENSRSRAHRDSTPLSSSGTAGGFHQKVQMSGVSCILGLPPRHNLPIIKTPELPRSSNVTTVVPPSGEGIVGCRVRRSILSS